MAGVRVLATNHTSFTVSNLDRTLGFFRDALGFEIASRAPRSQRLIESITGVKGADVVIAYVKGPGHDLELIEYVGPEDRGSVRPRPCDVGFAHVACDVDEVVAGVDAASRHGFLPLGPPTEVDQAPNRRAHRGAPHGGVLNAGRFRPLASARSVLAEQIHHGDEGLISHRSP